MIKDLITPGIGFTPGSIKFILTRGLDIGPAAATFAVPWADAGAVFFVHAAAGQAFAPHPVAGAAFAPHAAAGAIL